MKFKAMIKSTFIFFALGCSQTFQVPKMERSLSSTTTAAFSASNKGVSYTEEMWIAPNFTAHDFQDFLNSHQTVNKWQKVFSRLDVYLFYIGNGDVNDAASYFGQSSLQKMGSLLRANDKKVAVEVGGLYSTACTNNIRDNAGVFDVGRQSAHGEMTMGLKHLNENLGQINYIVLDDPMSRMLNANAIAACAFSPEEAARQLTIYMKTIKSFIPNVQFILLSSLPNWQFQGHKAKTGQVHGINLDLKDVFRVVMKIAQQENVSFRGIQIDNPYDHNISDLSWNQINDFKNLAKEYGLKANLVLNTDHGTHWKRDNPRPNANSPMTSVQEAESKRFGADVYSYMEELKSRKISFDSYIVQSWYRVPYKILPESEEGTFMNAALNVMNSSLGHGAANIVIPSVVAAPVQAVAAVENTVVQTTTVQNTQTAVSHSVAVVSNSCSPEEYLRRRPDVKNAGVEPLSHYNSSGRFEGMCQPSREYTCTAEEYYRLRPDVLNAGAVAIDHYSHSGRFEGMCKPAGDYVCPTAEYFRQRPDVKNAGVSALEHYTHSGRYEGMCKPF